LEKKLDTVVKAQTLHAVATYLEFPLFVLALPKDLCGILWPRTTPSLVVSAELLPPNAF
jgi:hypothetical protein